MFDYPNVYIDLEHAQPTIHYRCGVDIDEQIVERDLAKAIAQLFGGSPLARELMEYKLRDAIRTKQDLWAHFLEAEKITIPEFFNTHASRQGWDLTALRQRPTPQVSEILATDELQTRTSSVQNQALPTARELQQQKQRVLEAMKNEPTLENALALVDILKKLEAANLQEMTTTSENTYNGQDFVDLVR